MLLSNACAYALRATLFLTARAGDGYTPIREISDGLGISFQFLTKILQQLTQAGLMASYRGPRGGVRLTRPAEEITLLDIVLAVDGPDLFETCVLGLPGCGELKPCPLHDRWRAERARLRDLFAGKRLSDMGETMGREDLRL